MGASGDGGAVVSCDPHLAERARLLREYGWKDRYMSNIAGMNSRLDEVQSAVLRVRLSYLPQDNASRCKIAETYQELLESTP